MIIYYHLYILNKMNDDTLTVINKFLTIKENFKVSAVNKQWHKQKILAI